jgi:hypothetical protein
MSRIVNNHKTRFASPFKEVMAKSPVSVLLPAEIDIYVRSLPNRTEWLRQAIAAQVERDKDLQDTYSVPPGLQQAIAEAVERDKTGTEVQGD